MILVLGRPSGSHAVTGRRVWTGIAGALLSSACAAPSEDLPPVAVPPSAASECTPDRYGQEMLPITNAGDTLGDCAVVAWSESCGGAVQFDVAVDEVGRSTVKTWRGRPGSRLRACVEAAVRDAALGPATDCRNALIASTTQGRLLWNLRETGTSVQLANVQGIVAALDPSCVGKLDPRGGRAKSSTTTQRQ